MNQAKARCTLGRMSLALAFTLLFAYDATSAESVATSTRMSKRLGGTLSLMGDPYPSIFGMNVHYNLIDMARVSVGYGNISMGSAFGGGSLTTIGAGITGFVPGWSLSPTFGFHISSLSGSGDLEVQGVKGSGLLPYASLGMDWQTRGGFNLNTGYNIPFGNRGSGAFYAALGWYFDFTN